MSSDYILSIHVQNACNSDCSFCIVDATIYNEHIPRAHLEAILDENEGSHPAFVNFHGGEPTIRTDLVELCRSVASRGMGAKEFSVQTNGRRLADLEYTRSLVEAGVNLFVISLHGHTAAIQDETARRSGSFNEAVQGIRNARTLGCRVRTNSVVAKNNYRHLVELVDLLAELDVDVINISALHTDSQAVSSSFLEIVPHYVDLRPHLVEAVERIKSHGIPVILEGFPLCVYPEEPNLHLQINRSVLPIRMYYRGQVIENYDRWMDDRYRVFGAPCEGCVLRPHCGGVYKSYIDVYGWHEFRDPAELGTRAITHPHWSGAQRHA